MNDLREILARPQTTLRFYNTKSRRKEIFTPLSPHVVRLYTCGPTVYNFAHIGNFRTYIFEDILRRTLKFFGYSVQQAMNITDVEDKTIRGAIDSGKRLDEFVLPYIHAFFVDLAALNIERVEYYPKATEYIPQMIDFIQKLIDKGIAYQSKDKSIYFSIEKFPNYGALSHLKLDELVICDAHAADEYDKENIGDFVLWKAHDPKRDGPIFWNSPFGRGRPGWHLECSTMSMSLLGESIDIHAGGVDNIFPHHENEIAQSESYSGKPFVNLWMHSEHLLVEHKKMSKSLGNFYTLRDLQDKGLKGFEVRYMLMQAHYRTQLNFTLEAMEAAKKGLKSLISLKKRLEIHADSKKPATLASRDILKRSLMGFSEALADDLNISSALSYLFDLLHGINGLYDRGLLSPGDAYEALTLLEEFDRVLAIFPKEIEEEGPSQDVLELFEKRKSAKEEKNFLLADSLRSEIAKRGYLIEDTPYGSKLKKK